MKSLLKTLLVVIAFLAVSNVVQARTRADRIVTTSAKQVRNILSETIGYPEFGYEDGLMGTVLVNFTISPEGAINIRTISSGNEDLKDYVTEKLGTLNLSKVQHPADQIYHITLYFYPTE